MAIANMVKEAWTALGFHVALNAVEVIKNDDYFAPTDSWPTDIMDDIYLEEYRKGNFEIAAVDLCALSPDAFSMLSVYAKAFSGEARDMSSADYELTPHISGYDNEEYNKLIEDAFAERTLQRERLSFTMMKINSLKIW